jgi:hypothetical protein
MVLQKNEARLPVSRCARRNWSKLDWVGWLEVGRRGWAGGFIVSRTASRETTF